MILNQRSWFALSAALGLLACCPAWAADPTATGVSMAPTKAAFVTHFVKPTAVDCAQVLPAPPAPGTLAGRADLEAVLQAQAWRTPEQIAWAKRVDKNDAFLFGDIIGAWFTRENLPKTTVLMRAVDEDRHEVTEVAKKLFARARPWVVDPRVTPCVGKPSNDSYPSGHTASLFARAGVLAEIFPEKRTALFDFAHRAAWGRVHGGVHFPSDLVGGWMIAEAFIVELRKNPDFLAEVTACRAEVAPFVKRE
ncbi:phosphatase PAP2 family protein [Horticoccus sp. 23ND18S-11]|uniref:phosphatase PAP2 family protein n=1 Tax=Horticoccus sp. 23ND18S-11 TaxID=3391832 RepID=UPI0039C94B59